MSIEEQDLFFNEFNSKSLAEEAYFGIDFKGSKNNKKPYIDLKPIVDWVDKDSSSFKKLLEGDLILSINNNKIKTVRDFFIRKNKLNPGDKVSIKINRKKKIIADNIDLISKKDVYKKVRERVFFNVDMKDLSGNYKCQDCGSYYHNNPKAKPIITYVTKNGISYNKLEIGDQILSINKVKINTLEEFDNLKKNIFWNSKVILKVKRKGEIENIDFKIPEYNHEYLLNDLAPDIDVEMTNNQVVVRNIIRNFADTGKNEPDIRKGDIIVEFNSKKINKIQDWFINLSKKSVGDEINLKIKRENNYLNINYILGNLRDFIKIVRKVFNSYFQNSQKRWEYFLNEWDSSNYSAFPQSQLNKIALMNFDEDEIIDNSLSNSISDDPREYDYSDDDYVYQEMDDEKIKIKSNIKKSKVRGKDVFLVKLANLPDDIAIQQYRDESKKVYIKIMVYDVTDLNQDKYHESIDGEQYFIKNCKEIKTSDPTWSYGENILIQEKELGESDVNLNELAIPFSTMVFPKYGKRKLSFRCYLCTEKQKFDLSSGRILKKDEISYDEDRQFIFDDEAEFDVSDYPELLAYHSSSIDAFYKQPGYLEKKQKENIDLKIALYFCFEKDNKKKTLILNKIKENIRYGSINDEENIYKILSLKKNYDLFSSSTFDPKKIAEQLKKNLIIEERYDLLDKLLNFAVDDETFSEYENDLIDNVAKILDVKNEKYNEIKKRITASAKFVDFGKNLGESIFGINNDMSLEEKIKILRKEYSRWNALTNNSDKLIRNRAREMRDLAAKLRSELSN